MACELEDAFDRVRDLLPDGWLILSMEQDGAGWYVTCGHLKPFWMEGDHIYYGNRTETRAGTLTKALNRMVDLLEEHNAQKRTTED
jgi:hypothetical protein